MTSIQENKDTLKKLFRDPNPFNCINKMEHQTQVLALCTIGTAAIFQCAIQLNIGLQEEFEQTALDAARAEFGGTRARTDDDDDQNDEVRVEQGHHGRPDAFNIAGHLAKIHAFCVHEVTMLTSDPKAKQLGNPRRISGCSAMVKNSIVRSGVLDLFCKGEPIPLTPAQQAAEDRMVAKGMIDAAVVDKARATQAKRQGETWRSMYDDVLREYNSLVGAGDAATDDPGVSGMSAETAGEHHFGALPAKAQLALWDKLLNNLRPAFQRWCVEIITGFERQYTIEEAESLNEIFIHELKLLRESRRSFVTENEDELLDAPGLENWSHTATDAKAPPAASAQPVKAPLTAETAATS